MDKGKSTRKPGHKRPADTTVQNLKKRIRRLNEQLQSLVGAAVDSEGNSEAEERASDETSDDDYSLVKHCWLGELTAAVSCLADLQDRKITINWIDCMVAAMNGESVEVLSWLLTAGADPNSGSPLHYAVWKGNMGMVEVLLMAGADPNALDIQGGKSPLFVACEKHSLWMVKRLVQAGANLRDLQLDERGYTPAQCVVVGFVPGFDDMKLLRWLAEAGAPFEGDEESISIWEILDFAISNAKSTIWSQERLHGGLPLLLDIVLPLVSEPSWEEVNNDCKDMVRSLLINWWWQKQQCILYAFGTNLSVRHLLTLALQSPGYDMIAEYVRQQRFDPNIVPLRAKYDPLQRGQPSVWAAWHLSGLELDICPT